MYKSNTLGLCIHTNAEHPFLVLFARLSLRNAWPQWEMRKASLLTTQQGIPSSGIEPGVSDLSIINCTLSQLRYLRRKGSWLNAYLLRRWQALENVNRPQEGFGKERLLIQTNLSTLLTSVPLRVWKYETCSIQRCKLWQLTAANWPRTNRPSRRQLIPMLAVS